MLPVSEVVLEEPMKTWVCAVGPLMTFDTLKVGSARVQGAQSQALMDCAEQYAALEKDANSFARSALNFVGSSTDRPLPVPYI